MPTASDTVCRDFLCDAMKSGDSLFAFAAALLDPTVTDVPFVFVNQRMVQLTGFQDKDLVGRSLPALFGAETDTETRLHIRLGIQSEIYTEADLLCYRRGKSVFWNRITLTPIRDHDGRTRLFLMSGQDVTRIRRLEDALMHPDQVTARTMRSMQVVIDKTEARFQAVKQYQSVVVAHLERRWQRHLNRGRGPQLIERVTLDETPPVFAERRPSALMGGSIRANTARA